MLRHGIRPPCALILPQRATGRLEIDPYVYYLYTYPTVYFSKHFIIPPLLIMQYIHQICFSIQYINLDGQTLTNFSKIF